MSSGCRTKRADIGNDCYGKEPAMKKLLIAALVISPFVYAYYHKPPFRQHQEKIYLDIRQAATTDEETVYELPEWDALEFADWFIFTATREKKLSTLVSFGLVDHVFVVDSDWAPKAFKLKAEELK
jgi:hypothetical protein